MAKLASRLEALRESPVRKLAAYLAEAGGRKDIISFGGGAPSLLPPEPVMEAMQEILRSKRKEAMSYGATRGIPELRSLISEDVKRYGGVDVDPKKEMIIADGGTQALLLAFLSLFEKGDEVIIMDPTYLGYAEALKLPEAKSVSLPVHVKDGYQPDVEQFKSLITEKTNGVVILSPDNPTGRVTRPELVRAMVEAAIDRDLWVVSDDIYNHIIYEGTHTWVSELDGAWENTITVNSFSKTASMPGLRVGYAYGPAGAMQGLEKVAQYMNLCPNSFSQLAAIAFLKSGVKDEYIKKTVLPTYRKRRDQMGKSINKHLPKAKTATPGGAFYFFVDMRSYLDPLGMSDQALVDALLSQENVIVIPGSYFGENGRGHVRMTFVSETEEQIEKGAAKMRSLLDRLEARGRSTNAKAKPP